MTLSVCSIHDLDSLVFLLSKLCDDPQVFVAILLLVNSCDLRLLLIGCAVAYRSFHSNGLVENCFVLHILYY